MYSGSNNNSLKIVTYLLIIILHILLFMALLMLWVMFNIDHIYYAEMDGNELMNNIEEKIHKTINKIFFC